MQTSDLDAANPASDVPLARRDRSFLGHPSGLGILALTEGWIGFSSYGMQSLLVLYMTGQLLQPRDTGHVLGFGPFRAALGLLYGPLSGEPLAAAVMGLYSALIYAAPILGGLLADRLLGGTRTILLGAVLMTAGHFLMAFEASFLIALACLILGMGCAGSIKAQLGGLNGPADLRRADAFQIYTMSANIAVILAPLVCGTLGETYGWHWGSAAAGLGMLIGLAVYLAGRGALPPEPVLRPCACAPRRRVPDAGGMVDPGGAGGAAARAGAGRRRQHGDLQRLSGLGKADLGAGVFSASSCR